MIVPALAAIMPGSTAWVMRNTLPRLRSRSPAQVAGSESTKKPAPTFPPTLLTSTATGPSCDAAARMRAGEAGLVRSAATKQASAAPRSRHSATRRAPASWSRPTATTLAPSAARPSVMARPILAVAPVTITTQLARPVSIELFQRPCAIWRLSCPSASASLNRRGDMRAPRPT